MVYAVTHGAVVDSAGRRGQERHAERRSLLAV
jgi:hypothetical protein